MQGTPTQRPAKPLVGVVHLPALPSAPRHELSMDAIELRALADARALAEAGFDAIFIENFGDAPFHAAGVELVTVAAMARLVACVRRELPTLAVGVNVLRNDAAAGIAIAVASGATFIRINVHVGATATDQGILDGRAATTLRLRRALGASIAIWADVHVKHGRSLAHDNIADEARDAVQRGLADVLIVTGPGTGWATAVDDLRSVRALDLGVPVYVGSGVNEQSLALYLAEADGIIVGSALKVDGRAGEAVDAERAKRFAALAREITS